jgi:predicted Zn finger-like uncharacterized protein
MKVFCPNCTSEFHVSETFVDKRGRCPKCKHVFTISRPPESEVVDLGAGETGEDGPPPPPPVPPKRSSGQVYAALAASGAAIMFVSFFVPWWSMRIYYPYLDPPSASLEREMRLAGKILDQNEAFLIKHSISPTDFFDFKSLHKGMYGSVRLFGWNFATGIVSLVFSLLVAGFFLSLLVAGAISTPLFVRQVRKWAWTGALPAAGLCAVILIMSFVFWLATPGESTATILSQGASVGPFLALGGSMLALFGAVMVAVGGLRSFLSEATRQRQV